MWHLKQQKQRLKPANMEPIYNEISPKTEKYHDQILSLKFVNSSIHHSSNSSIISWKCLYRIFSGSLSFHLGVFYCVTVTTANANWLDLYNNKIRKRKISLLRNCSLNANMLMALARREEYKWYSYNRQCTCLIGNMSKMEYFSGFFRFRLSIFYCVFDMIIKYFRLKHISHLYKLLSITESSINE